MGARVVVDGDCCDMRPELRYTKTASGFGVIVSRLAFTWVFRSSEFAACVDGFMILAQSVTGGVFFGSFADILVSKQ